MSTELINFSNLCVYFGGFLILIKKSRSSTVTHRIKHSKSGVWLTHHIKQYDFYHLVWGLHKTWLFIKYSAETFHLSSRHIFAHEVHIMLHSTHLWFKVFTPYWGNILQHNNMTPNVYEEGYVSTCLTICGPVFIPVNVAIFHWTKLLPRA